MRHCACCGKVFGYCDLFCASCWRNYQLSIHPPIVPLSHRGLCLWPWNLSNDSLMRNLVYALKGGGLDLAFERLSLWMVYQCLLRYNLGQEEEWVVVPAPPAEEGMVDHAHQLAVGCAQYLQGSFCPALKRQERTAEKQKHKTIIERKNRKMSLLSEYSQLNWGGKKVIFIDDVITTGGTVESAYRALNKPKDFFFISLLYKELH